MSGVKPTMHRLYRRKECPFCSTLRRVYGHGRGYAFFSKSFHCSIETRALANGLLAVPRVQRDRVSYTRAYSNATDGFTLYADG